MGQTTLSKKLKYQWQEVDRLGETHIYKNIQKKLAQKQSVRLNSKISQQDYLAIYNQKVQLGAYQKPITSVLDWEFVKDNNEDVSNLINVFIQFTPYKLGQVKKLSQGQATYVLSQALAGFHQLYQRVGSFPFHQDLIGFNTEGKVKVSQNDNLAQSSVDNQKIILMSTSNPYDFDRRFIVNQQNNMVQDIFMAVADHSNLNDNFVRQLQSMGSIGFNQARQFIINQISQKSYYVPDHLQLPDKRNIKRKSGVFSTFGQMHPVSILKEIKPIQQKYAFDDQQNQNVNVHSRTNSTISMGVQNFLKNNQNSIINQAVYQQNLSGIPRSQGKIQTSFKGQQSHVTKLVPQQSYVNAYGYRNSEQNRVQGQGLGRVEYIKKSSMNSNSSNQPFSINQDG